MIFRQSPLKRGTVLSSLLLLTTCVAAADDENFAFDVFSDIAPILSLFGEQFATQFTSQSLTWVDHLIFAMVPLGILTMISAAIRVSGPRIAKSFIGRARENRAQAEVELMSSTSSEVCEMFNGKSITRAIGQSKVGHILLFPELYNTREDRGHDNWALVDPKNGDLDTCGIHSIQTACDIPLIRSEPYHSHSYMLIKKAWEKTSKARRSRTNVDEESGEPATTDVANITSRSTPYPNPPNIQLNLSTDQFNFSRMNRGYEIFLVALGSVILQLGVIAIAVVTVFHQSTRDALGIQLQFYAFPCYLAGCVFLSTGMAICSLAIEQSTTELSWKRVFPLETEQGVEQNGSDSKTPKNNRRVFSHAGSEDQIDIKDCPRLIFLQQGQKVQDMAFDPYVILAGPKQNIISSNRTEEILENSEPILVTNDDRSNFRNKYSNNVPMFQHLNRRFTADSKTNRLSSSSPRTENVKSDETRGNRGWELLTIVGVLTSVIGFITQFIGLRGLAYPVAMAQLFATFFMAIMRAVLRRKLGRIPSCSLAVPGYELDFLATHIVYCPEFRRVSNGKKPNSPFLVSGSSNPADIFKWTIVTARPGGTERHASLYLPQTAKPHGTNEKDTCEIQNRPPSKGRDQLTEEAGPSNPDKNSFQEATSLQLLRVRKRLGDLCSWESKALEISISLVRSIEYFLNESPKPAIAGQRTSINWALQTYNPTENDTLKSGFFTIQIHRASEEENWTVDLGMVEAALSMWMANVEARTNAKEAALKHSTNNTTNPNKVALPQKIDWRRSKSSVGTRYKFCRILGENCDDDVLKRDLSWWVDDLLIQDSDTKQERARNVDVDLVIGFHGSPDATRNKLPPLQEMAIIANGYLPVILAQHLLTSFMWAVVEYLPRDFLRQNTSAGQRDVEIIEPHKFMAHKFNQTWLRPTLRHRKLTKAIEKMESYGLGSMTDILLCMIPAFSTKDLLPNDEVLRLILPSTSLISGWFETARCYNSLLDSNMGAKIQERYCFAVVVMVMDFLYLVFQPYDQTNEPDDDLKMELSGIVNKLVNDKFQHILVKLAPAYEFQQRREAFLRIFKYFQVVLDAFEKREVHTTLPELFDFLESVLGFSRVHQRLCRQYVDEVKMIQNRPEQQGSERETQRTQDMRSKPAVLADDAEEGLKQDLFGWSALHYALTLYTYIPAYRQKLKQLIGGIRSKAPMKGLELQDKLDRSPVHIAALAASKDDLPDLFDGVSDEIRKKVLGRSGIDGMTPLHLATRAGNDAYFKFLMNKKDRLPPVNKLDVWGRNVLHIAAKYRRRIIASQLLEEGVQLDQEDEFGNTPLVYFLKLEPAAESMDMVMDLADVVKKRKYRDKHGKSILHLAVELSDVNTIRQLRTRAEPNVRDAMGRIPLQAAILAGREDVAIALLEGENPTIEDEDVSGVTTLMHACEKGYCGVISRLFSIIQVNRSIITEVQKRDTRGRTVLHHAVRSKDESIISFLIDNAPLSLTSRMVDSRGRTPLHDALENGMDQAGVMLLGDEFVDDRTDLKDEEGDTILLTACLTNCVESVKKIIQRWPQIINEVEKSYGQTPLSVSCELGNTEIVSILLGRDETELNMPATDWGGYTPLHIAVTMGHLEIIDYLLNCESIEVEAKDDAGRNAMDIALQYERHDIALLIRRHIYINRIPSVLEDTSGDSEQELEDLVQKILEALPIETTSGDDKKSAMPRQNGTLRRVIRVAIKSGEWRRLRCILHLIVLTGDFSMISDLELDQADLVVVDENNWSYIDYRRIRYGQGEVLQDHSSAVGYYWPSHMIPASFDLNEDLKEIVEVTPWDTTRHQAVSGKIDIRVIKEHPIWERLCLASRSPISPLDKHFYFEVEIIEDSGSRIFGIGFWDSFKSAYRGMMPGWCPNSWGYHGDDGCLFLSPNEGQGIAPSPDFGESGTYHAGDTVGCYLNILTGEGFCTLNGKKLNMGDAFEHAKFKRGKIYPCVGMSVNEDGIGLHVRVNLGSHPFLYQGPEVKGQ